MKEKEGYISNEYLRELIVKFNRMNIDDTGAWCQPYLSKLENKYKNNKIEEEKYQQSLDFITRKQQQIADLHKKYMEFSDEDRRHYNYEFDKLKAEICDAFMKVINGRIISFKLVTTKAYEDIEDIRQECLMTLFTYINRYDEERNSSAFAFVTQLITNAILLDLNQMKERAEREIAGLDFYNNMNTIDDPHGNDGLKDYME